MLLLNVSFGIYALTPIGWLFMAIIILGEAFLMSLYLIRKASDKKIYLSALASNVVSGVVGFIISMILNGGWWLVIWFPWVSDHEVNVHKSQQLIGLAIFYFVAMVLSILIELFINHQILKKNYPFKKTFIATLIANAYSYAIGAFFLYLLCF